MASVYFDGAEIQQLAGAFIKGAEGVGKMAQAAVRKTALDIEKNAKAIVPVDTGNLKSSIGHSDLRSVGTSGSIEAEVGPTANYGSYVEFGTSTMAPAAFMGPSLDRATPAFVKAMEILAERAANGGT
jgi:HK97 gp10 family phage protein